MAQEVISALRGQCSHRYPALVMTLERGRRRARCLNCGALGTIGVTLGEAMSALRELR